MGIHRQFKLVHIRHYLRVPILLSWATIIQKNSFQGHAIDDHSLSIVHSRYIKNQGHLLGRQHIGFPLGMCSLSLEKRNPFKTRLEAMDFL